jgi:hypothetical protein
LPKKVNPFRPTPVFEVDRNDNVIFAVPSDYDLKILNSDHKLFRRIQKNYDPVEILEEDEDGFQIVKRYALKWLIK